MPDKIAIFVPPFKLSTAHSDESTARDATLLRQLIQEARKRGYQVIEMNHPKELWDVTDLEVRRRNLLERLRKIDFRGKKPIFIGHSLGAFLLKSNLRELSEHVGTQFKVFTIGGIHLGGSEVPEENALLRRLSSGWDLERGRFKELSEGIHVPVNCRLVEFYSPQDPILHSNPKIARTYGPNHVRVPIIVKKPAAGIEPFITHHLFSGHERIAATRIRRHLK
ncbi:MAG: hypothetical protein COT15_03860 [Candidatus Diapherotrites archaeon CG08_land_8_20_14_0_20_34_12]|nr:MAG: hypothetical protein COT15_03860 [Candidatus Diapherotrites archaeon CG08_land_8_20_14_0_20_34_12]